jgi:hypothetical protein
MKYCHFGTSDEMVLTFSSELFLPLCRLTKTVETSFIINSTWRIKKELTWKYNQVCVSHLNTPEVTQHSLTLVPSSLFLIAINKEHRARESKNRDIGDKRLDTSNAWIFQTHPRIMAGTGMSSLSGEGRQIDWLLPTVPGPTSTSVSGAQSEIHSALVGQGSFLSTSSQPKSAVTSKQNGATMFSFSTTLGLSGYGSTSPPRSIMSCPSDKEKKPQVTSKAPTCQEAPAAASPVSSARPTRPRSISELEEERLLAAHLALLKIETRSQDYHEVTGSPIFTMPVLKYAKEHFSQYGFLAGISGLLESNINDVAGTSSLGTGDPRVFFNISAPSSVFICGSQGSGKSHTLSCLLENCLMKSDVSTLASPLAGLLFHYDSFTSDVRGTPCEAAHLASNSNVRVRVLCSPTNLETIKVIPIFLSLTLY